MYAPSRAESGCLSYACFVQAADPDAYLFFEEWADEAAVETHFATAHFADFMERFPALISGPAAISTYATTVVTDAEPAPLGAPVLLAGRFAAKSGRRAELIDLSTGMFASARAEAGCISYDFYEEIGRAEHFLFFERWRDKAALDAHFATPQFAAFGRAFPDLIQGEADIRVFAVAAERKL
jgi:quinol monooxygenase YgiN